MPYDLYPAVDETYNFPPEVRNALAKDVAFRNQVVPMTTVARNNLTAGEKWDGRVIVNTDTDHLERWDTVTWQPLIDATGGTINANLKFGSGNAIWWESQDLIMYVMSGNQLVIANSAATIYRTVLVGSPTHPSHAVNKNYVDQGGYFGTIFPVSQGIASGVHTNFAWADQLIDTTSLTKVNPYKIRVDRAGFWVFSGTIYLGAGVGGLRAYCGWGDGGGGTTARNPIGAGESICTCTWMGRVNAGVEFMFHAYQSSGAQINTTDGWINMKWLGS